MGPLEGLRVIEIGAIGPLLHAGILLADLGADVVRVERPSAGAARPASRTPTCATPGRTGRLDLRTAADREFVLELVAGADVLLEGSGPVSWSASGSDPTGACERNPRLIYGRMTGWGQDGPLAAAPATTSTTSRWPARSTRSAGRD